MVLTLTSYNIVLKFMSSLLSGATYTMKMNNPSDFTLHFPQQVVNGLAQSWCSGSVERVKNWRWLALRWPKSLLRCFHSILWKTQIKFLANPIQFQGHLGLGPFPVLRAFLDCSDWAPRAAGSSCSELCPLFPSWVLVGPSHLCHPSGPVTQAQRHTGL